MVAWLIPLLIALAVNIVAYIITPKPKAPKPIEAKDMDGPTAEAGRPIPVVFGQVTIKGLNFLWWGDKSKNQYQVDS